MKTLIDIPSALIVGERAKYLSEKDMQFIFEGLREFLKKRYPLCNYEDGEDVILDYKIYSITAKVHLEIESYVEQKYCGYQDICYYIKEDWLEVIQVWDEIDECECPAQMIRLNDYNRIKKKYRY